VWLYYPQELNAWRQVTAANASQVVADAAGDVVGEFPGQGVWLFSNNTWQQLTANNASTLSLASGSVNPYDPAVRVDNVFVAAEFPGQGLWRYGRSVVAADGTTVAGWMELTANNAAAAAVNENGQVGAAFPGQGVWFFYETGWQQVTAAEATSLGVSTPTWPELVAEFPGHGVWRLNFQPGYGWEQLTTLDATSVGMNAYGDTVAVFPGWGVGVYARFGSAWEQRSTNGAALVALDLGGQLYATFPGQGVWFDWRQNTGQYVWTYINSADATSLSAV
jgi:hypothetical protein